MIINLAFIPYVHAEALFMIFIQDPWETSPDNLLGPCLYLSQGLRPCSCISSWLLDLSLIQSSGLPHNLARIFFVLKSLLLTSFTTLNSYVIVHSVHSEVSCVSRTLWFWIFLTFLCSYKEKVMYQVLSWQPVKPHMQFGCTYKRYDNSQKFRRYLGEVYK